MTTTYGIQFATSNELGQISTFEGTLNDVKRKARECSSTYKRYLVHVKEANETIATYHNGQRYYGSKK